MAKKPSKTGRQVVRVEDVTFGEVTSERLAEVRDTVERAAASLWAGESMRPWRAFYATMLAQLPIQVGVAPFKRVVYADGTSELRGASGWTDGERIFVNAAGPPMSTAQMLGFLLHEVEHVARFHLDRQGPRDMARWNVATDLAINAHLRAEGFELPDGALYDPGIEHTRLEEDIYDSLPPSEGDVGDDLQPGDGDGEARRARVEDAMRRAAYSSAALAGRMPGRIEEWLDAKAQQTPSWARQLRRLLDEGLRGRRTWARPNRRGLPVPGRRTLPGELAIVLDTSGSMSQDVLAEALGLVSAIAASIGCTVALWQCDTEVHGPMVYAAAELPTRWPIRGRGGTLMEEAARAIDAARPRLTLWITDGEWGDLPSKPAGRHVCVLIGGSKPPAWAWDEVVRVKA